MFGRRRFLGLAAGASACWLGGCGGDGLAVPSAATPAAPPASGPGFVPKVNGGINLQPLRRLEVVRDELDPVFRPELVALQLRTVYELGFDGIRVTASFGDRANFLAAIPYVRAARALGLDAVVVLSNFSGFQFARALWDEKARPRVLKLCHTLLATPPAPAAAGAGGQGPGGTGRVAFQVLNEPALFAGVPPDVYVREILAPCFAELRRLDPQVLVVSAAEVGTVDGPPRLRAMLEAGLEDFADRIAVHVYDRAVLPLLAHDVRGLVWVTESGAPRTAQHLGWFRDVFPEIRARVEDVSRLFLYTLYETAPGGFRLIDIVPDGTGFRALSESADLLAHLAQNVARAAAGAPLLGFEELVPDVRAYFPSVAEVAAHDEVLFG